jgi:hypothetical protein
MAARPHPQLSTDATFAVVPTWVLDSPVSANAVRLYAVLARYTDTDGVCYPGRRLLATRMQVGSTDTVDRAMTQLVGIGAVTITRRFNDKREPIASLYQLHVTPGGVAANLRVGGRKDAPEVAAPVRHRTITIERENPPTPAADASGEQRAHHGQHKRCRACGTTPRQQADRDTQAAQRKPPWCGHCDEATRTIDFEPAGPNTHPTVQRCHACHPLEIGA